MKSSIAFERGGEEKLVLSEYDDEQNSKIDKREEKWAGKNKLQSFLFKILAADDFFNQTGKLNLENTNFLLRAYKVKRNIKSHMS